MTDQELKEIRERWKFPMRFRIKERETQACTDIPKLLDEIERLNQVLDSYEKAVSVVIAADAHNCIECSDYRGLSEAFDILTELVTESDLDSDSNDRT